MHVTCILLEVEKRNKGCQTLHEQANNIVLIDVSLPSLSTGLIKTCAVLFFVFVACVILRIIFKFRFSQYACLCEQVGFLLRWSHIHYFSMYALSYRAVDPQKHLITHGYSYT